MTCLFKCIPFGSPKAESSSVTATTAGADAPPTPIALGFTARQPRINSTSHPYNLNSIATASRSNMNTNSSATPNKKSSTKVKFLGGGTKKDTNVIVEGPLLDDYGHLTADEVEKRRTYSEISTTSFKAGGSTGGGRQMIRLRYASCTQRGYYPDEPFKKNQDAISITQNFAGEDGDLFFAIHDGHGSDGHDCAVYARDHLPKLMTRYLRQDRAKLYKERQQGGGLGDGSSSSTGDVVPFNPKLWPMLDEDSYERVSRKAHLDCNTNMIRDMNRCKLSGTTSISAAFHDGRFIISNVGDSRAVLGTRELITTTADNNDDNYEQQQHTEWSDDYGEEKKEIEIRPPPPPAHDQRCTGRLIAVPLSVDQTPWRKDERRRIKKAGGRILTIDQIEGSRPIPPETMHNEEGEEEEEDDEFGDRILGMNDDTVDIAGDPPRVWLPEEPMPGTAYTRSLGDGIAQTVGVTAEPEMVTKDITFMMGDAVGVEMDEVLVLASDGVFEFLTNQEVIDICDGAGCPMDACRKIMDQSYEKWVEYESRTDDISAIVIWMDTL